MNCIDIVKKTLVYANHEMTGFKKQRFENHLKKCDQCYKISRLIQDNYESDIPLESVPDFKESVMKMVKDERTVPNKAFSWKRKVVLFTVLVALVIGLQANAEGILKRIEDLINLMKPSHEYIPLLEFATGETYDTLFPKVDHSKEYEEIDRLFEKVQNEVQQLVNRLQPGEYDMIEYDNIQEGFFVKIAKLSNHQFTILYGLKDGRITGLGEYKNTYNFDEDVIRQIIEKESFVVVPEYLPPSYRFDFIRTIDDRVDSILYTGEDGQELMIRLVTAVDTPFMKDQADLIIINDRQAVWTKELSSGLNTLLVYLGEDTDKSVLQLTSTVLNREEMIKIASNLRFHNAEHNEMTKEHFFKEIKDPRVLELYENIAVKEKAGEKIYDVEILRDDENLVYVGFGRNDAGPGGWYMIDYRGLSYDQVKIFLNYPLWIDESVMEENELYVHIAGRPYEKKKKITFDFRKKDQTIPEMTVTAQGLPMEYNKYTLWDMILLSYMESADAKIVKDQNDHPFIMQSNVAHMKILQTILQVEDRYVMYHIVSAKSNGKDFSPDQFQIVD